MRGCTLTINFDNSWNGDKSIKRRAPHALPQHQLPPGLKATLWSWLILCEVTSRFTSRFEVRCHLFSADSKLDERATTCLPWLAIYRSCLWPFLLSWLTPQHATCTRSPKGVTTNALRRFHLLFFPVALHIDTSSPVRTVQRISDIYPQQHFPRGQPRALAKLQPHSQLKARS